jgi:ribosome biogenesis GTPase A
MDVIHWYPGHMAKAKRQLSELIKFIDAIIEVRDARLPMTSHNSDIDSILIRRPRLVVLNKSDLADPEITEQWRNWFEKSDCPVLAVNGKSGQGVDQIWRSLNRLFPPDNRRPTLRIGVVGIPNVGKSSLLNRLIGTSSAKTGNLPGVTRGKQWIKRNGFEILDTPGLLPPKIADQESGIKLALVGTIREEIIPTYDLALMLLTRFGEQLFAWRQNGLMITDPEAGLEWYARKRGFLMKGGEIDLHRGATTLLNEFRNGRLGKLSLEVPSAAEPDAGQTSKE